MEIVAAAGQDPGSLVFLWGPRAGFSALGARGKPAEQVADEAAEAYLTFRPAAGRRGPPPGRPDADLPGPGRGPSIFTTEITSHLLTNLWVIEQFLGPRFQVKGGLGERGEIFVQ